MDRVRTGLIGAGHWARTVHLPALRAHPGIELVGMWSRRPRAGAGVPVYRDVDALIRDVEAVAFAVPPAVQAELAVRAAAAGRHLVCEKPVAQDLAGAQALAAAARGVVTSVVLTLRHDRRVRAWLAGIPDGAAGPDTVAAARWLSGSLLGGAYAGSAWRAEQGALLDLGPHIVDLLDAALGPVADVEWAHRAEPDLWRFALRHAGGARSTATLSLRLPVDPSEIELAVFGAAGRHRFAGRADGRASLRHLLDEFVAAVRGTGPPPALDVDRGLALQEILDAVRRTAG